VSQSSLVGVRIMKFSPYVPLVFAGKFYPEILRSSNKAGWVKSAVLYV